MDDQVSPPSLTGRAVSLTPLFPSDYPALYELAISEQVSYRWRFRGGIPNYEAFVQSLYVDVLSQFVVRSEPSGAAVGHVVSYGTDFQNGYSYAGAMMRADLQGTGSGIEAFALFVRYLFATWNLRKVYLEVVEFNMPQFGSAIGRYVTEEGRLREHVYYQGRLWDQYLLALYRAQTFDIVNAILPG